MIPACPCCNQQMSVVGPKQYHCEPCRQIICFLQAPGGSVSEAAPSELFGRSRIVEQALSGELSMKRVRRLSP
jgi:hypothetical protein